MQHSSIPSKPLVPCMHTTYSLFCRQKRDYWIQSGFTLIACIWSADVRSCQLTAAGVYTCTIGGCFPCQVFWSERRSFPHLHRCWHAGWPYCGPISPSGVLIHPPCNTVQSKYSLFRKQRSAQQPAIAGDSGQQRAAERLSQTSMDSHASSMRSNTHSNKNNITVCNLFMRHDEPCGIHVPCRPVGHATKTG